VIPLTLAELAVATSGRLSPQVPALAFGEQTPVTGPVVTDSRQVRPGALFVALPGEQVDGHDYAAAAVAAGAVAVLAGRDVGVPAVITADPLVALGRLARTVLDRLPGLTVVGVTGSSGKTSTKDLLAVLLAAAGPTVAPVGSFNNELGLPLTALRCDGDTRYLVAEMGAREPGNIAYLCGITPPRVAVLLNVGAAHLGVFGSREATARTKGELLTALPAGGVAVLNADDPVVRALPTPDGVRRVLFGRSPDAQVRADDVRLDGQARPSFTLVAGGQRAPVALRLHGEHHVSNALAAAAVLLAGGLPVTSEGLPGLVRVAELLSGATPASRWRMDVATNRDGLLVVNDAYNANPDSMRAALEALAAIGRGGAGDPGGAGDEAAAPGGGPRRTWAVLGEMLELGPDSVAEHEAIGALAAELGITDLIAVGEGPAEAMAQGADRAGGVTVAVGVPDQAAALRWIRRRACAGDVLLVKASRSVGLDALAAQLLSDRPGPTGVPLPGATPGTRKDGDRIDGGAVERVAEEDSL
jgi:UDP-N-acetylmuramoyl-tripeptide--D-alanyl-D-alanine ligase